MRRKRPLDGDDATAWKATAATEQWLQIAFASPQTINEFKIREDPSSSVIRYVIQYWDTKNRQWMSCFNGRGIGREFVAPIVSRTTLGVRLMILQTTSGNPAITEFGAYNDPVGTPFNDPTGAAAVGVVGK